MTGIIPTSANGGVQVRDASGTCLSPIGVSNAYCPDPEFTSSCPINYLPDGCTARITPAQLNAIESELLCLAETFNPDGNWNCGSLCNIGAAFTAWSVETTPNTLYALMQTHLCALPSVNHATAIAFPDPRLILCDGLGNLHKLTYQLATTTAIGVIRFATDAEITANSTTTTPSAAQLNVRTPCGAPVATPVEIAALTGTEPLLTCIGGTNKVISLSDVGAFAGDTNLTYTASPTEGVVNSNAGTDATIPLSDTTNAGLLVPLTGDPDDVLLGTGVFGSAPCCNPSQGPGLPGFVPPSGTNRIYFDTTNPLIPVPYWWDGTAWRPLTDDWTEANPGLVQKASLVELNDYNRQAGNVFGPAPVITLDDTKGITPQDMLELLRLNHVINTPLTINIPADFPNVLSALNYLQDRFLGAEVTIQLPAGVTNDPGGWPVHVQWEQISVTGQGGIPAWPLESALQYTGPSPAQHAADYVAQKALFAGIFQSSLVFPPGTDLISVRGSSFCVLNRLLIENASFGFYGVSGGGLLRNVAIFSDGFSPSLTLFNTKAVLNNVYVFGLNCFVGTAVTNSVISAFFHGSRATGFGLSVANSGGSSFWTPSVGAVYAGNVIGASFSNGGGGAFVGAGNAITRFIANDVPGGPINVSSAAVSMVGAVGHTYLFQTNTVGCQSKVTSGGSLTRDDNLPFGNFRIETVDLTGFLVDVGSKLQLSGLVDVLGATDAGFFVQFGAKLVVDATNTTLNIVAPLGARLTGGGNDVTLSGNSMTTNVAQNVLSAALDRVTS